MKNSTKNKKLRGRKIPYSPAPWEILDDWFETHPDVMGVPARATKFLGMACVDDWILLHEAVEEWEKEETLNLISEKTKTNKQFWINLVDAYKARKTKRKNEIK